jgi:hypothetical protein
MCIFGYPAFRLASTQEGRIARRGISCTALQNALKSSICIPFLNHECSSEKETGQRLAIGGKTNISSGAVFSGFTQTRSVIRRFSHEQGNTQVGPLYFVFLRRHVRTVRRFGSLMKAYELVGYRPRPKVLTRNETERKMQQLREDLYARLKNLFSDRVRFLSFGCQKIPPS